MSQPKTVFNLIWFSFVSWLGSTLLCLLGIGVTAASVGRVPRSTVVLIATVILVAAEIIAICISIALVLFKSRSYFQPIMRFIWTGAFTLLQLGTGALLLISSLLALNR
jgi:hypothetical protein